MDKNSKTPEIDIAIKVRGKTYHPNLDDMGIDRSDINNEISLQPGKFAWFATLHAIATNHYESKKEEKKKLYAVLDKKYRSEGSPLDKITESSVEQGITRNPKFIKLSQEVLDAKLNADLLYAIVESFRQKKDMLVTLASNMRAELDSKITIKNKDGNENG